MTALTILATWLSLAGAGLAALSALRRAGAREDAEARAASPHDPQGALLADLRARPISHLLAR